VVLSLANTRQVRLPAAELLLGAQAGKFPVACSWSPAGNADHGWPGTCTSIRFTGSGGASDRGWSSFRSAPALSVRRSFPETWPAAARGRPDTAATAAGRCTGGLELF
jgi:hypothetical protein